MTVHKIEIGEDSVADFALLVAEAAGVLTAIAEEAPEQRRAELEELHSVEAEALSSLCGIPEAATSASAIVALPEALRRMLSDVVAVGEALTDGRLWVTADRVHAIEALARAVSASLDRLDDSELVARQARIASTCADTLGAATAPRRPADPVEALVVATIRGAEAMHGLTDTESQAATRKAV